MKFLLVIIIFFIIFIIAEIGTIAFKMTGLSIETARFQAISLITNTGFTTSEAELIVRDRTRKKNSRGFNGYLLCFFTFNRNCFRNLCQRIYFYQYFNSNYWALY